MFIYIYYLKFGSISIKKNMYKDASSVKFYEKMFILSLFNESS